ncbi:rCG46507 [Rattus norvegicus]|uniref:RCG46507 n=1 Tax=Rattus norvegicus TaxID=10116 RepID=A6ICJ3_RAT|nr:rCG46507 [Rattus norvegicus]
MGSVKKVSSGAGDLAQW